MSADDQVTPPDNAAADNLNVNTAADLLEGLLADDPGTSARPDDPKAQSPKAEDPEPEGQEDDGAEDGAEVDEQEPGQEEGQEPVAYELGELAEAMGLSVDELLSSVKHRVKASGKELEVTLEEALRGYQREEDYSRKTMEVAEMRKSVEQANQVADAYVQQMQQVAAQHGSLLQQAEQALLASYQGEDWNTLRQNDPAEFAARKAEYEGQYGQIQQQKQQAMQQLQYAEQQKTAYIQQVLAPQEQQRLRDAIPEWSDPSVAETERQEVAKYLLSQGYQPQELENLYDHRSAVVARKAWLWDNQKAKADKGAKVAKEVPGIKALKPGNRKSATAQNRSRRVESLKRLRKSGSIHDAVAALPDFD